MELVELFNFLLENFKLIFVFFYLVFNWFYSNVLFRSVLIRIFGFGEIDWDILFGRNKRIMCLFNYIFYIIDRINVGKICLEVIRNISLWIFLYRNIKFMLY